jgi:hypothetical protein
MGTNISNKLMLLLLHASLYFNRRPHISFVAKLIFLLLPSIKQQVDQTLKIAAGQRFIPFVVVNSFELTPRARQIYEELKVATEKIQKVRR